MGEVASIDKATERQIRADEAIRLAALLERYLPDVMLNPESPAIRDYVEGFRHATSMVRRSTVPHDSAVKEIMGRDPVKAAVKEVIDACAKEVLRTRHMDVNARVAAIYDVETAFIERRLNA